MEEPGRRHIPRNPLVVCDCATAKCRENSVEHPDTGARVNGTLVPQRLRDAHKEDDRQRRHERRQQTKKQKGGKGSYSQPRSSPSTKDPTVFESRCTRTLEELLEQLEEAPAVNMEAEDYLFQEPPSLLMPPEDVTPDSLRVEMPSNRPFFIKLEYLENLAEALRCVDASKWPRAQQQKESISLKIIQAFETLIDRLSDVYFTQARDLEPQYAARSDVDSRANGTGTVTVDSRDHTPQPLKRLDPLVAAACIIAAVAILIFGLSEDDCRFLLASMNLLVRMALRRQGGSAEDIARQTKNIPADPRTVLRSRLKLESEYTPYVCCPSCFACYRDEGPSSYPERCTSLPAPDSQPCNAVLTRTRTLNGRSWSHPIRRFLLQDLKAWVARFLSRPVIVKSLQQTPTPKDDMTDLWDASELTTFWDEDGRPFLTAQKGELRLVFGMNIDGFNPFQMKEAGRKASTTGIYLVCLNLPPQMRYRLENMFFAGLIPGPHEPRGHQINHILALLVKVLLSFWKPGVRYTHTALKQPNVLVRIALLLIICDTPAACKVSGFGHHNHTHFCPYCHLTYQERDNLDAHKWRERSTDSHRRLADRWKNATSSAERAEIYKEAGVRYSALLDLPYWDPLRHTVIDLMHMLYLGNCRRLCRTYYNMSSAREDGDGTSSDPRRLGPHDELLNETWRVIQTCTAAKLKKIPLDQLKALIIRHNIPLVMTAGKKAYQKDIHVEAILEFRKKQGWFDGNGNRNPGFHPEAARPKYQRLELEAHPSRLASLHEYYECAPNEDDFLVFHKKELIAFIIVKKQIPPTSKKERNTLAGLSKGDLLHRIYDMRADDELIDGAGELLVENLDRFEQARSTLASTGQKRTAILGRGRLRQIWNDMLLTIIPTWMGKAPHHIGDGQHRKVSADDWRLFVTVNLVITMIRLWGHHAAGTREQELLDNMMHLVTATKLASYRTMSATRILGYTHHITEWLRGLLLLFPGISLESNQHLSLHLPHFLLALGPSHGWRCFVFERWNYILQLVSTNNHFGELEATMSTRLWMNQRLRAMILDGGLDTELREFEPMLRAILEKDNRGTMLNDILSFTNESSTPRPSPKKSRLFKRASFAPKVLRQVAKYVARTFRVSLTPSFIEPVERKKIQFGPVSYSTQDPNCYVAIGDGIPGRWRLAKIERLFSHTIDVPGSQNPVFTDYAVVRYYQTLSPEEVKYDYYRKWDIAGGQLHHAALEESSHVIPMAEILCHCCVTRWEHWSGISGPVVHGLPCDRVSITSLCEEVKYSLQSK